MRIEIINVQATSKPTKNGGTYTELQVAYKNLGKNGAVEGKKIMSFSNKDVFANLQKATNGQVFEITTVKEGEYWQWSKVEEVNNSSTSTAFSSNKPASSASLTPKSTYETTEERALRQKLIVRQSSISSAIETLKVDKKQVDVNEVLKAAQVYYDWVMGNDTKVNVSTTAPDFSDMEDDVPM